MTNSFFFTMEFWLSRSLSHILFLFSRWNSGYHEAFSRTLSFCMMEFGLSQSLFTNSFFFHDGILAITEPFHEFFFHMVESRLSRSLFTNFSFTSWNLGYHEAFSRIFLSHGGIHKMHNLGEDSFHIYHKEYLHRIRLVKNLAFYLEPPLQGKEYGPPYSNVIVKKKANVFSPKSLIDS
jgi:hypothetical protein